MVQPHFLCNLFIVADSPGYSCMAAIPDPLIVNLEIALAHQGKTIEDLSNAVAEQWTIIDRLQKKLDALTSRFLELEESAAPPIEAAKPPHW